MKIKNTKELVLRARGHAKLDHIAQGTYGDGTVNGDVEFKGCAIACLATPHRKKDMRAWFIKWLGENYEPGYSNEVEFDDHADLIPALEREFGITQGLARAAEALFESQSTHGAAINFIPAFAEALNEGADITPKAVQKMWLDLTGYHLDPGDFNNNMDPKHTEGFLAWVKEQR